MKDKIEVLKIENGYKFIKITLRNGKTIWNIIPITTKLLSISGYYEKEVIESIKKRKF